MNTVFLCLGGNLGNREENLNHAREFISKKIGVIKNSSSIYETASWGNTDQPAYLNQVLELYTTHNAEEVLNLCLSIEKELGRTRNIKWENRLIDIDILFFNKEIIDMPHLKIPHPLMAERLFVLQPLNEIAAEYIHPVSGKKVSEMLAASNDTLNVSRK